MYIILNNLPEEDVCHLHKVLKWTTKTGWEWKYA